MVLLGLILFTLDVLGVMYLVERRDSIAAFVRGLGRG